MKSISGKKLANILQKKGWTLVRIRGSHHTFEHTLLSLKVVVPIHGNRDLPIGTLSWSNSE